MLRIVPLTFRQASEYVGRFHRHNKPPVGCKFCIGVRDESDELVGVAMVGRPVARSLDDGLTIEVNRTCTQGHRNANSALYGAAWRIAREMGYRRIITYTQHEETGASLRAAGWMPTATLPPPVLGGRNLQATINCAPCATRLVMAASPGYVGKYVARKKYLTGSDKWGNVEA